MPPVTLPTLIHLEGTTLEGGGQLLRIALGLSSLTKKPINITKIRGNRSGGGGLKAQHLTSVQWLGKASNARLSGVELKSKEITFAPYQDSSKNRPFNLEEQGGEIRITQTTPGAINLVLQAILPYLLFSGCPSPIRVRITGGTNVSNSPSYEYISRVLFPTLELVGISLISSQLHSRGWSQGSTCLGSATYTITPLTTPLPAFQLTHRGAITHIQATVIAPKQTEQHFRDELDHMFSVRESRLWASGSPPEYDIEFDNSHHEKRYYILLVATSATGTKLGRDWLYDRAVRPGKTERIAPDMVRRVSDDLIREIEHGGCVDEYVRDQLVVFQALAKGRSAVNAGRREGTCVVPSLHSKTAMWVCERILGVEFEGEGKEECEGVGYSPTSEEMDIVSEIKKLDI